MTSRLAIAARFRAMPIQQKLFVVFLLTTAAALTLAAIGVLAADSVLFRRYLERDLTTFVRIVGDNSAGALAFDDEQLAKETLGALRAREHVEVACLYQAGGTLLASYSRPDFRDSCPLPSGDYLSSLGGALEISHRIVREGQPMGTLVLRYDLQEVSDRLWLFGALVFGALVVSSILVQFLSARLRWLIAGPILELTRTTTAVARSKDYGIRAKKLSDDEMGLLADALNQMMERIQSRDNELQTALAAQQNATATLAQVNDELHLSNQELARSNQDLERFAFVASHDLQEPLRMITSYSQLLAEETSGNNDKTSARCLEQIVGGATRMRELLADLLAYTEMAGASGQEPERVDLNSVLERVKPTVCAQSDVADVEIVWERMPTLQAHEGRMVSLFQNLIGNAVKYRAERPLRIRITASASANEYEFAVEDNGIGIAPEYYTKVFEAFKRLHGREVPGTGIGLAICQRIVERYGGRIWVESEVGVGSTFRFTLPIS